MKTSKNNSTTFEEIFRYALDQELGGRPVQALDIACVRERVENAALAVIEEQGLLNALLCELELFKLCKTLKRRRRR